MASRTVSVTLTATAAQYITSMERAARATEQVAVAARGASSQIIAANRANTRAVELAVNSQIAALTRLRLAQQRTAAPVGGPIVGGGTGGPAATNAARQALLQQQALGAQMNRDIQRQTQLDNLHSQALAENAARDEASARRRVKAQQDVGKAFAAAGVLFVAGAAVSVSKAAQFEQAISHVNAVTDATAGTLKQLSDAALEAGASTVFTATESANAIEELAKAGLSTKDILGGGLKGALDLASAGSLGVADAAEISASALVQFNLAGDQAVHIADLLSAGANKAQGSVQDLGTGLSYVGPVAASLGVSIDQTTGALALLANNGILAEKGGTALRGMLLSLTSPSKRAQQELDALGITLYDARGNFIGIDGAAQQLQDKLGGLSQAQRNYSLGVIFSNAQVTAANVLLKGGAQAVDDWTGKVNDAGNASRTAQAKLDNLRGDVEKLGGAFDTAFITTGQGGLDPLRGLTQGATKLVDAYNSLSGPAKTTAFAIAAIGGAAGLAAGAFLLLGPRIVATRAAMSTMSTTAPRLTSAMGALGKAAGALGVLSVAAVAVGQIALAGERGAPGIEAMTSALLGLGGAAGGAGLDKLFANGGTIGSFEDALQRVADPALGDKIQNIGNRILTLGSAGQAGMDDAKASIQSLDQALTQLVSSGSSGLASSKFDDLAKRAEAVGIPVDKLKALLPGYEDALAGVANQSSLTAGSTADMGAEMDTTRQVMDDQRTAADRLKDAIAGLNGGNTDVARAQIALQNGLDAVKKQFVGSADSTSLATARGRENLGVVLDQIETTNEYAQSIADQAAATTDQATAVGKGRQAFEDQIKVLKDTLGTLGLSKTQIDGLIATYGKVPTKVQTDIEVYGVDEATGKAATALNRYNALPDVKRTQLLAVDRASAVAAGVQDRLNQLPDTKTVSIIGKYLTVGTVPPLLQPTGHADGGHIVGPGGPRDDRIPALLSNGEFVVNAAATARNRGLLESINAQKFADGGIAQLAGRQTLGGISAAVQSQLLIISNVKSSAADIAKAAAEVKRLQKAWQDTADAIDKAKQRRELLYAIDKADRDAKVAAKTKDKGDDKDAAGAESEARKALREFDADAKRTAQGALVDRRAANAEARADTAATIEANRRQYVFDHASAADQLITLNNRIAHEKRYTDEWVADVEKRESLQADIDEKAKQRQADADKAAQVKADYLFGQMTPAQQLADVNRRIAGETEYSEAWVALATQRQQIQKSIDDDAAQALQTQKQAVEAQASTLNDLLDQQASLTEQLNAAQDTYGKAVAGIKAARTDVLATYDITQRQSVTPGTSVANLLKNASTGNANFTEWIAALAEARRLGVSEAVIKSLGLDQGPQALGQLRQLNKASATQVDTLNTAIATRQTLAATQTDAEASSGVGQVSADIEAARSELITNQADLNKQLNTLGVDQGRSYGDAIAQGLLAASPGVRAAAVALIGGAAGYDQLAGLTAGTTQSRGFADGGAVFGPGGPRSDSIPAWLSNGEFVVNAASTAATRPILEAINAGRYADGGFISAGRIPTSNASSVAASLEVSNWELQMEVRRVREALTAQTNVIRENGLLGAVDSGRGW